MTDEILMKVGDSSFSLYSTLNFIFFIHSYIYKFYLISSLKYEGNIRFINHTRYFLGGVGIGFYLNSTKSY